MPINALAAAEAFRNKTSLADMQDARDQRRMNALKMADTERAYADQNVLRSLAQQGMPLDAMASQYQAQTGDIDTALKLRDKQTSNAMSKTSQQKAELEKAIKGAEFIAETGRHVTADNYGAWKKRVEKLGAAAPGDLPDQYDPQAMEMLTLGAEQAWSEIQQIPGAPADTRGQKDPKGEWHVKVTPKEPKTPTLKEVYDESSPTKSRYVTADEAAGKPGKPSSDAGARKYEMAVQSIMSMGAPQAEAEQLANGLLSGSIKFNPNATAANGEFGAFVDMTGRPVQTSFAPKEEESTKDNRGFLARLFGFGDARTSAPQGAGTVGGSVAPAPSATGKIDAPFQPTTQEEFDSLPVGAYFIAPWDGKPYQKQAPSAPTQPTTAPPAPTPSVTAPTIGVTMPAPTANRTSNSLGAAQADVRVLGELAEQYLKPGPIVVEQDRDAANFAMNQIVAMYPRLTKEQQSIADQLIIRLKASTGESPNNQPGANFLRSLSAMFGQ